MDIGFLVCAADGKAVPLGSDGGEAAGERCRRLPEPAEADEVEFAGLCTFAPLGELPNRFYALANTSRTTRQRLAEERFSLFAKKFAPAAVLERALPPMCNVKECAQCM